MDVSLITKREIAATPGSPATLETPVQIIGRYADDYNCLEILRFFGTYPFTRFGELAVIHALSGNGGKFRIESALRRLIHDGVVKTHVENGVSLYRLTEDESVHNSVVHLAKMDWTQWSLVLKSSCTLSEK